MGIKNVRKIQGVRKKQTIENDLLLEFQSLNIKLNANWQVFDSRYLIHRERTHGFNSFCLTYRYRLNKYRVSQKNPKTIEITYVNIWMP